jgi:hypothetical protein
MTVEIIPLQILPGSIYRVGEGKNARLRHGADLFSDDLFIIAIKAARRDPKLIAEAVEAYLQRENNC